jgi:hypothetical protein
LLAYNTVNVYSIYVDKIKEDEMTRAMRVVEWTSQSGAAVRAEIVAERGYRDVTNRINADGDIVMVTKREVIDTTEITMYVNGKCYGVAEDATSYYHRDQIDAPASVKSAQLVLKCGDTVITIQEPNAEQVLKAKAEVIAEAEADQDWAVIVAERTRKNAEDREYEDHVRKVESMMTLNGHTY